LRFSSGFLFSECAMSLVRRAVLLALSRAVLAVLAGHAGQALAEQPSAFDVQVSDVTAKVGEPAVMRATLKIRDGYRILKHYNNRVIELSSLDDGVAFESRMVPATL